MFKSKWFFLLIFCCANLSLRAQKIRLARPSIALNSYYFPSSNLIDSTGSYSNENAQLNIYLPVLSHFSQKDSSNSSSYLQVSATHSVYFSHPQISSLIQSQNLLGAALGLSSFWVKNKKNIFLISFNSLSRNDETTITNPSFRYSGSAFYKRYFTPGFSCHFGMVYSYVIGRAVLLPAFGLSINTGKRSRLNINFPNKIYFVQKLGKSFFLNAYLKPYGSYNYISNESGYLSPSTYYLRQRENHAGLAGTWKFNSRFLINGDLGFAFNRSFRIAEGLDNKSKTYYKSKIGNNFYAGIGFKYSFGKQKKLRAIDSKLTEDEKEELLNDPYLENSILD